MQNSIFKLKKLLSIAIVAIYFIATSLVQAQENLSGVVLAPSIDCVECVEGFRLISAQQFKEAEVYWRNIYNANTDKLILQAISLQQIAIAQRAMGNFKIAKNSLHVAINKLAESDAKTLLGSLYYQLATLEIDLKMWEAAKLHLQNAIRLIDVDSNVRANAMVQNTIGELFSLQQDPKQAMLHYLDSFELFLTIDDKQGAMEAARGVILSAINLKQYQQATDIYTRALKLAESSSSSATMIRTKISLLDVLNVFPESQLESMNVKYVHSVLLLKQILNAPENAGGYNEVYALGVLAELYYRVGRLEQSLQLLNKAIFSSQALWPSQLTVRNLMLSGKINRSQGKLNRSIQAYQLAVNNYSREREQSMVHVHPNNTNVIDENSLYYSLADLLLAKAHEEKNTANKQDLLLQARAILEQRKVTELQNYFNNTCDFPSSVSKKNIDKVINKGSAAIYPIILPDRIEILVTFSTGIEQFQVKENYASVEKLVNKFRTNLENLNTNAFLVQAQLLYRWIINPLESELERRGIRTIVVVSEQMFRTIPLSVLHDGKQYLVEKYALAVVPGLQLIDPQQLNREKLSVLLSGISEAVQGYPPLRYVQGELEEIQDLFVTKLLLNREFVTKNFENAMLNNEYSIAHLASHSEFRGSIEDSYILTFDGKMSMQRLGDITSLTRSHSQPIELLTLSSCQTAVGDDKAALGLAGVALKAGARSTLATLWSIDDFASSILVSEFYKQLLDQSISKAEALQRAQLKLIKSRRFDHPAYWSSFLLIGNWL